MDKPTKRNVTKSNTATKSSGNKKTAANENIKKNITKKEKVNSNRVSHKRVVKKSNNVVRKKSNKKLVILVIVICILLFLIGCVYYLLKSPKFNISSISVKGNLKIIQEEIIKKSGINIGDNIVKSSFKINKNAIIDTPYIECVKTKINFPSSFVIEIKERKSIYFAYDKEKNLYYKLDSYGVILEVCDRIELKVDELLVYGIVFEDEVKLGSKINEIDYSKLLVYKEIQKECLSIFPNKKITKVNFENSLSKIHLDDKIEVVLPNNTKLKYNLTFLQEILKNEGDVKGTIDMTKENPTLIKF
ncbi:MAG: FtsQ-type POTRA domain-containing protein [Clostridia bacterium]